MPTLYLVTTWGYYPLGVYSSEEKAKARVAAEWEKRKRVKGMTLDDEYRIIPLRLDE